MKVKGSRGGQGRKRGRVHHPEPEHPSPRTLKAVWFSYRQLAAVKLEQPWNFIHLPSLTPNTFDKKTKGGTRMCQGTREGLSRQLPMTYLISHAVIQKKKKKSCNTCSAHVFLLEAVQHWARCAGLRSPGPSWVLSLRQFGAPRSVFQRENLHFMGSLNRKGSVSSWFSLKRSVIKPLPYNQYTNTSAGCVWCSVISIWAWGRNVVCLFPSFILDQLQSRKSRHRRHKRRLLEYDWHKIEKRQICLNNSTFPYRICSDCDGTMGKTTK